MMFNVSLLLIIAVTLSSVRATPRSQYVGSFYRVRQAASFLKSRGDNYLLKNNIVVPRGGGDVEDVGGDTSGEYTEQSFIEDENEKELFIERRWSSLMECCKGNFSGSIGWYDVVVAPTATAEAEATTPKEAGSSASNSSAPANKQVTFQARSDNGQLNMRMSFTLRSSDSEIGDWVVFHAYAVGSRNDVLIEKYENKTKSQNDTDTTKSSSNNDSPLQKQAFYCFKEGIIGRCGRNMRAFPVIEHGFWDPVEGMRRTVVLVYNKDTLVLERICFLQQAKQIMLDDDKRKTTKNDYHFNVSDVEPKDLKVLPKDVHSRNPSKRIFSSSKEREKVLFRKWGAKSAQIQQFETVNQFGLNRQTTTTAATKPATGGGGGGALERLFGIVDSSSSGSTTGRKEITRTNPNDSGDIDSSDQNMIRFMLPNGVMVACPLSLKPPTPSTTNEKSNDYNGTFFFSMGYKRRTSGKIQVLEIVCNNQNGSVQRAEASWYKV